MIIIICIYSITLILCIIFRSYQRKFLNTISKKQYHLFFLFPVSLMMADIIDALRPNHKKNYQEELKSLYVFEDCITKSRLLLAQTIAYVIGIILLFNTFALVIQLTKASETKTITENMVNRPNYGEKSHTESYQVVIEDEDLYFKEKLQYKVTPRAYTEETFYEVMDQAKSYISQRVLGENQSADKITTSLNLMKSIPSLGLKVSWRRDDKEMVEYDGSIANKSITQKKQVVLTATISFGDFKEEYQVPLTILPFDRGSKDELLHKVTTALQEADVSSSTEDKFSLPKTVDGAKVYFLKEKRQQYINVMIFGVIIASLVPLLAKRKLKEKLEKREEELRMDYPEVVNKLSLLLEAGMTVTRAWTKIVQDYEAEVGQKKRKKRYSYEEMLASYYELKNGLSESQVYDNFGRRIKLTPYMKLGSLLAQNSTKGMEGILRFLKGESVEAFAERKELAKRLGEKAGTKMLLPMGLMLGIVLIVIIVPAFSIL